MCVKVPSGTPIGTARPHVRLAIVIIRNRPEAPGRQLSGITLLSGHMVSTKPTGAPTTTMTADAREHGFDDDPAQIHVEINGGSWNGYRCRERRRYS